jgi:hypothetical protein
MVSRGVNWNDVSKIVNVRALLRIESKNKKRPNTKGKERSISATAC